MWPSVLGLVVLTVLVLSIALTTSTSANSQHGELSRFTWKTCNPPQETFFYSLRAYGVPCSTARQVVTGGNCIDSGCSRTRYGPWRCRNGSSIADRAKLCRRGQREIVARASGD